MFWLFVLIVFIIVVKFYQNKISFRVATLFRKGFHLIKDTFGVYTFVRCSTVLGKTYSVIDLIDSIRCESTKVITNVYSYYCNNKDFCIYNNNLYDIINKFNSGVYTRDYIIFYDEIFSVLENNNKSMTKPIRTFISQLRKRGLYLITTAQEWLEINITFRRYSRYQIDCSMVDIPFIGTFSVNVVHDGYQIHWDNLQNDYVAPVLRTTIKKCSKSLANSYDTHEIIEEV